MTAKVEDYSHLSSTGQSLVAAFRRKIVAAVAGSSPGTLLEVGCGQGWLVRDLAEALPDVSMTGIDVREDAIEFARGLVPSATFVTGDGHGLEFGDHEFDVVVSAEVLEHVEDPHQVLDEIVRVGRERFVISVPHEPWFWLANLIRGKYLRTLGNCPGHVHHWTRGGFKRLLEAHFRDVKVHAAFPWLVAEVQGARSGGAAKVGESRALA